MNSELRKLINTIWNHHRQGVFVCMVNKDFYTYIAACGSGIFIGDACPLNCYDNRLYIFDVELIVSEQLIHNYHFISVDDYKTWLHMAQYRTGFYSGREIDLLIKYKVGLK